MYLRAQDIIRKFKQYIRGMVLLEDPKGSGGLIYVSRHMAENLSEL